MADSVSLDVDLKTLLNDAQASMTADTVSVDVVCKEWLKSGLAQGATGIPRITRTFLAISRRGFTTSGGCSFHSCAQPLAPVAATSTLSKAALYAAVLEDDEDDNTESDRENSERTD
ncbi:hypothetical protein B0H11DRAFT_2228556 [Mycena galericulata]|nr:hypothetical protein B0H11DRAFT_2228556 [Mycena galericulata]